MPEYFSSNCNFPSEGPKVVTGAAVRSQCEFDRAAGGKEFMESVLGGDAFEMFEQWELPVSQCCDVRGEGVGGEVRVVDVIVRDGGRARQFGGFEGAIGGGHRYWNSARNRREIR